MEIRNNQNYYVKSNYNTAFQGNIKGSDCVIKDLKSNPKLRGVLSQIKDNTPQDVTTFLNKISNTKIELIAKKDSVPTGITGSFNPYSKIDEVKANISQYLNTFKIQN